jgi:hypothetical protein
MPDAGSITRFEIMGLAGHKFDLAEIAGIIARLAVTPAHGTYRQLRAFKGEKLTTAVA